METIKVMLFTNLALFDSFSSLRILKHGEICELPVNIARKLISECLAGCYIKYHAHGQSVEALPVSNIQGESR